MFGYIYITTNKINGKKYIGKHVSTVYDSDYIGSGVLLKQAIDKYGLQAFDNKILDGDGKVKTICDTLDELNSAEIYYINLYNCINSSEFYNVASGGDGGDTLSHLPEQQLTECKNKMSKSQADRWKNMSPDKRENIKNKVSSKLKGTYYLSDNQTKENIIRLSTRIQSDEERKKKSDSLKKYYESLSDTDKKLRGEKISQSKKGKCNLSDKQKEQISESLKEYYQNHQVWMKNKHHNNQTKEKISKSKLGRIHIKKQDQEKVIHQNDLEEYLNQGWELGRLEKNKQFKQVVCIEDNTVFNNVLDIINYYNLTISVDSVRYHIRKNTPINGKHFKYR